MLCHVAGRFTCLADRVELAEICGFCIGFSSQVAA